MAALFVAGPPGAAAAPSTFVVNTAGDPEVTSCAAGGLCSLRAAINAANAAGGGSTIDFAIGTGPQEIAAQAPLPEITQGVWIDGTSQPGYQSGGPPVIALDGTQCPICSDGLGVTGGTGTTIEGLSVSGFPGYGISVSGSADATLVDRNVVAANGTGGILVSGATSTQIAANDIGTDGTTAIGNGDGGAGIDVTGGTAITVGGQGEGQDNVISGNSGDGIHVTGLTEGFTAEVNLIGLDSSGAFALGNGGAGIRIDGSGANHDNTIAGNVISGNADGVVLADDGVYTTSIAGNLVGTDAGATAPVPNTGDGLLLENLTEGGITVGGTTSGTRNIISGNGGYGIEILQGGGVLVEGNYVGTGASGAGAFPNKSGGIALDATSGNTIGLNVPGAGNLVSGNDNAGIALIDSSLFGNADSNTVEGNKIGVDASGTAALPNTGNGISIGSANNTIGGLSPGSGNVVSGNGLDGVSIQGGSATGNLVAGNLIGTNAAGTSPIGNAQRGVFIAQGAAGNTIGGTASSEGNVISGNLGGGVAMGTQPGSGNDVEGNRIGTDSSGTAALGNALFGVDLDGSGETVGFTDGGGNTIALNGGPGVRVSSGSGDAIRENSIHDNTGLGIDVSSGANNGQSAPTLSQASMSAGNLSVAGSFQAPPGTYSIDLFQSPTCDPSGSGEGATFVGTDVAVDSNGTAPFSISLPTSSTDPFVTATATGPDSSTSEFSNCVNTAGTGSLSGTVAQTEAMPADVTATGTMDWAVWGFDRSPGNDTPPASLTPNETKANGGRQISDLSVVGGSGAPRGFGVFTSVPFNFDWTDGAPDATVSGGYAGLTAPAAGQGLQFTVPADTTSRTLTIWTSSHFAQGTLSAHLSDGSAPDFTQTTNAVQGQFTDVTENVPAIFTLHYKAASAGQHLTVTWTESASNGCSPSCDDVVLYAAALSGGGNATSASASLSAANSEGGTSVGMSGSNDPIASIPLSAFQVTPSGITPAPINGLPINGLPINGLPINGLPINGLPINGLPINGLPINGLPINGLPINGLPINGLPINGLPINGLPINGLELPGQSWEQILAGTPLAGLPLQTITLQQVLDLNPQPAAVKNLTLGDLELADSALGQLTIGALLLGSTPINGLGLPADALASLQQWCEGAVTSGDAATECSLANIGNQSLFALGLAGAPINGLPINGLPINGLPINGLPINGLPINGLDLSASPINGLPINGLPINGLPINGLPPVLLSAVIDCTKVDCATATLGEAAAAGAIPPGTTYGQLLALLLAPGSAYQNTITLGDLIGLLIKRSDVPWETLPPRLLSVFDTSRPMLDVSAGFTLQGSGAPSADVKLTVPDGFDYDPGSATLAEDTGDAPQPLADPTINGQTLDWQVPSADPDHTYTIAFRLRSGTNVGPAQVTETVSSGSQSDTKTAAFTVTDSFSSSADPVKAPTLTPNEGVQMSALPTQGAVDYYKIAMPPAGTRVQVHLTNLPADYDLALYSPQTTSVRTGATSAPPLQGGIVPDQQINLGGTNAQLTPTGLEDVPDPGIPLVQLSDNRHTDDEDVGMVSPGGTGFITIAVFGYNGASSPQPYSLRVKTSPSPATETCAARAFPDAGQGTTPDSLPSDPGSLPSNLNTIVLVDEKRLGDTYGSGDETGAVAALNHLATGDASLGVSGVVIPVEKISGVQSLYDEWDSNPCNPDAANAVANAIANYVDTIVAARPSVKYVVFGGGDDQIPFFRLPDLSLIANESGFAGQFGPNEYQGSLAAGNLLSDDPYLDTQPVPASGQQLFPPNLAGGRLVETAQDITNAVNAFEHAPTPGALKSSTAFVSGYDFVADSSKQIAKNLTNLGVSAQTLIDDPLNPMPIPWGLSGLLGAAFPTGGPADINSWNGHYDNYRTQLANGDVLSTSNVPGGINGGIFFTMGCHAGFQTTDAVVGSTVLDWPQYFSEHNTGFVGNTGFGLGDTDSIAFSEEIMADLSGNLGGSSTLGDALLQAKQQYYLSRVAFSNYDEKALSEAELYGLPMYGVGAAPTSLAGPTNPDPVSGATNSTSPSQSPLGSFPGMGVQSASFSATPHFSGPTAGQNGDFYTNDGQVQAPNYRPLQPYVSLPAEHAGLVAHGVVIDTLTSEDHTTANGQPWTPDNVRPILNSSGAEPPPAFADESWPEKIPTLVSLGADQSLNLATGQFFTDSTGDTQTNVERLWTQIDGRVTYSTSADFTPPTIDSIDAFQSNGVVAFTGRFSDRDENGAAGTVAFAQVVYDEGNGSWIAIPLQRDSTSGLWSGSAPFTGDHVQFFVEVCDAAGNCGYSSNKGRYFDAQPLPPSNGGGGPLAITPSRPADTNPGPWYTTGLDVSATSSAGSTSISVDGRPFAAGPATLSGDGAHVVDARDSGGNTATAVYLIDSTGPTVTHSISPAAPNGNNGWYKTNPTVTFSCADNLSGVAACTAPVTLGEGANQGATGRGKDNAGNQSPNADSVTGIKVDVTPPTLPTFSGITPNKLYAINDLPAQSAITCSANDVLSGMDGCAITGYSASVGTHILTATATDKAGNSSVATLTYTVGFQAGDILPPVTAPSGDQKNPNANDLQVIKIKSTVPLKFQFYLDAAETALLKAPPAGSTAVVNVFKLGSSTTSILDETTYVAGSADAGNQFRWTGSPDYQYIYNMATKSLTAGEYYCTITLTDSVGSVIGQSAPQYFKLRS